VLKPVFVASVNPSAEAGRIKMTVDLPRELASDEAPTRLVKARGLLRSRAAEAFCYTKSPDPVFQVAGAREGRV
jgi:hypothetical protein